MKTFRDGNKSGIKGGLGQNQVAQHDNTSPLRVCFIGEADNKSAQPIKILTELHCVIDLFTTKDEGVSALLAHDFDIVVTRLRDQQGVLEAFEIIRLLRHCGHPEKSKLPVSILANSKDIAATSGAVNTNKGFMIALDHDLLPRLKQTVTALKSAHVRMEKNARDRNSTDVDSGKNSVKSAIYEAPLRPDTSPLISALMQNARQPSALSKRLVDMEHKKSFQTARPQEGLTAPVNAKKGLFERLGDMVLARLVKHSDTGHDESPVDSARYNGRLDIDSALMGIGNESYDEAVVDMKKKYPNSPDEPKVAPVSAISRSVRPRPNEPARVAPARSNPAVAARQTTPVTPPLASRSRRNTDAPRAVPNASSERTAVAGARLSQAEKNKVYERVRNLISTAKHAAEPQKPAAKGKTLRVCFLEDSCTSSQAIREMLGEHGHHVEHFSSAEEVMDALAERDYDLLLVSQIVALGGMDCEGLIRTLRKNQSGAKGALPIVALTANPANTNVRGLLSAGANEVVVKPVEGRELNDRLVKAFETPKETPRKVQGRARALRICFLEDSCTSSQAIRETLGEHGHTVEHFSSAEEALDALLEKNYDVLLASQIVALGGMDCEGLVRTIRNAQQATKRDLPIVVLTANPDRKNVEDCFQAGADDVVVKPIEGKLLNDRVAKVADAPKRPQTVRPLQVCFLEDSCTSSQAIREMLGEKSHMVDHFSSAEEALDAILEKDYDVLLASQIVALGGMDCEGLIETLRASPQASKRSLPIVVLTANPNQREHYDFFNAGAQDVVVKPIDGDALSERLQEAVVAAPQPGEIPDQLRICFLEDSCTSSQAIRDILGEHGHEVDHFSSAEEALDAVLEKDYDLLLASQIFALGGLDTEGLVKTVRESGHASKSHLPIVILTANSDAANMEMFYEVGANEVAIKPLQEDLNELVAHTMQRDAGRSKPKLRLVTAREAPPTRQTQNRPTAVPKFNTPAPQPQAKPKLDTRKVSATPKQAPRNFVTPLESFQMPEIEPQTRAAPGGPTMRGLGSKLKALVAIAALAGVGFGIWKFYPLAQATPVEMVAVEQGSLYKAINAPGRVVSKKKVEVTSSMPGQIVSVSAKEGDLVTKGQVLARLDSRAGEIQVEQANAKLDSSKKEVALTERTLDRLVRALQMGAVSRQMAEDAEAAVHAARARQRVAGEELRAAELTIERLDVVAPFNGVVTSAYAVDGLYAEPPGPLFTVVDMAQREVEVRIESSDTGAIRAGQSVMVSSDAFPDKKWAEKILRVAPAANRDNVTSNTVSVYISLGNEAPADLRFAQQIDLEIPTAYRENAIKLPFNAVVTREGRTMVAVANNGRVQYRPVTTGIEDLTHVEITSGGLKLGQQVILLNQEITEGQKVAAVVNK